MQNFVALFTPKTGSGTAFGNHVALLPGQQDLGLAEEAAHAYGDRLFPRWPEFYDLSVMLVSGTYAAGVDPFRAPPEPGTAMTVARSFLVGAYVALRPFAHFRRQWDAKPVRGAGGAVYAIHTGTQWAAEITLEDLRRALAWVEAAEAAGVTE